MLTQDRLKEKLSYDPHKGIFTWLARNQRVAGGTMTTGDGNKYITIRVDHKQYLAHRLAFLYMTGEWPEDQVDHINGNGLDNSWYNLRGVDNLENSRNQKMFKNNTSGVTGVYWCRRDSKWQSKINIGGKGKHLGYFTDKDEAIEVRKQAEVEYGFHENHGQPRLMFNG